MVINSNVFYVCSEKINYICWEKINKLQGYRILRDGVEIANSEDNNFVRPYEFDNDHHTELFKPATRNWLYFKDTNIDTLRRYKYQIVGYGGTTSESYESLVTEVYTE
jgi:hypothetical protein